MITIHEKTAQTFDTLGLGTLFPSSCLVTEELNGAYELELEHPYDEGGKWKRIEQERIIYASTPRGRQPFRIYNISPDMEGIVVNARHIFYDLLDNQSWAVSFTGTADSILSEWSKLLYTEMPFTFETDMTHEGAMKTDRMNPVQALLSDDDDMTSFVRGCGGEILRDHFNVSILAAMGQDRDVAIRYGKNLVGLEVTEDAADVKTRFLCYGSYGSSAVVDSPYISQYVYPKIYTIEDDRKTIDELKAEAQEMIDGGADLPMVNIKVDFVELTKTVEYKDYAPLEKVFLGDTVTVINQKMNFAKKAKVISYEWDCLLNRYAEVELGDFMPSLATSVTSGARSGSVASSASATAASVAALLNSHMTDHNNPHKVTAAQTGGSFDGGSSLPTVTTSDNGKVLMVDEGLWKAKELEKYLGEYEVTPATEAIVLSTYKLLMTGNVTVNAIPQSILDAEYQKGYDEAFELYRPYKKELAYIESTGTQYIDMGFKPNQNTKIVIDVQGATTSSGVYMLFGTGEWMFGKASSSSWKMYAYWNSVEKALDNGTVTNFNTRRTITMDKQTVSYGSVSASFTYKSWQSSYNAYLFAVNNSGTTAFHSPIKVYSTQVYDNTTLIRDYIPVLDWDDVPCLYDKVGRKFYYNMGTGNFSYPVDLPEGYTQLSYIKTSGTQYIRTGFVINGANINKYKIVADMAITGTSGWRVSGSGGTNPIFYIGISANNKFAYGNGITDIETTVKGNYTRHVWTLDCKSKKFTVDNLVNLSGIATGTFSGARNFVIGGYATSNTVASCHAETIYGYMFYENDVLVGHYIPCKNAGGTVGLYDLVNSKFYTNAGSGNFTYA